MTCKTSSKKNSSPLIVILFPLKPLFTTAISEVSLFKWSLLANKSIQRFCLSKVEPLPSVIESPKQTIVFFIGKEDTSKAEIKNQLAILLSSENFWLFILFPSSINEWVLEELWPDNFSAVLPKKIDIDISDKGFKL